MIRALSGSPLFEDMLTPTSKFVGEALEMRDVRTIFVGGIEDDVFKENRIILLLGPSSAEKSELIDFFCNYFYDVDPNESVRYHISNEKFNAQTPDRPVQCYIFNKTSMPVRPIIIDTPSCGEDFHGNLAPSIINKWLIDNWKMRLDVIAIVFSDLHRTNSKEEDELQQILTELPIHVSENLSVFITASDGSRTSEPLLRRFGLAERPKYTINTACVFQKPMEDRLNDEHRKRYWKMSVNQMNNFFDKVKETTPVTISGLPYIDDALYGASAGGSSRSSVYSNSQSTVIEVNQSTKKVGIRPTDAPPPPPVPPPVPPKPAMSTTMRPPPIPSSPPPSSPPPAGPPSIGIPLYNKQSYTKNGQTIESKKITTTPPRPPNFAPPEPPLGIRRNSISLNDFSSTKALTHAMIEQMRTSQNYGRVSTHYDYAGVGSQKEDVTNVKLRDQNQRLSTAGILGERRHSVPDDIRRYADETTPPPVVHDIADRYSTVAYMNQDPYVTKVSTRPASRSNVPVRDAHRLSRDDLRIIDQPHSSPSDSQSEELRRMYSGRSAHSVQPLGDISTRYVYDTAHRTYTSHGERETRPSYTATTLDRKRWSKSSEPRSETYINDPYYSGKDVVSGYGVIETRNSRTSLHKSTVPELVHSENKYDYQQIGEGQQIRAPEIFERNETSRRSRHQSEGSRNIHIERRVSPERQRKDRISGGEVYEHERRSYDAYSQINRNNDQYRPIGQGVQPPRYDQVPEQPNHYIIPNSMRDPGSPIQVRVHLRSKSPACIERNLPSQQTIYDSYGELIYARRPFGVSEETTTTTTTTRKEEIERKRRKKEEEARKKKIEEEQKQRNAAYDAYASQKDNGHYDRRQQDRDLEARLLEEQYDTRNMKRTTERGTSHGRGQHGKIQNNEKTRKTTETTTRRSWGWSPTNYRTPRDCFLNLLCFVIAPLVIIGIIVVIIVFVIIQ